MDVVNGGFVSFRDIDFEHLQEDSTKSNTVGLLFDNQQIFQDVFINKKYYTPTYFKFRDIYNKFIYFDTLRITYSYTGEIVTYKKPEDFYISFGIKYKDHIIREWFLPVEGSCGYTNLDLDLEPLFDEYEGFDEVFFRVLKHPGNAKIYFGSMYLLQATDELHNIKLALSDLLHLKYKKYLCDTSEDISTGDEKIGIANTADVYKGTSLFFGDNNINELHTVRSVDRLSSDNGEIHLGDEFDRKTMLYSWPAGTRVYKTFPASIYEMKDSESVFPLFYIYSEIYVDNEQYTNLGTVRDSYVRDSEGNHKVAVRRAWDSVTSSVSISVFSDVLETAIEMWRFLKSAVTNRDVLKVAGKELQFVVASERDISPDDMESLPSYIMDLTFYFRNSMYSREYIDFPKFKKMNASYEIKAVEVLP